ncbi:MAG: hypothetical protein A4E52_00730 [Pelotomaculum sp. PtaB.Bin013]|nr:MAG: hypothetical protein A4E52_00730 [Pelotomaculum sp. PtaB.Bin013]
MEKMKAAGSFNRAAFPYMNILLFLPPLTSYRFGQSGNTGGQSFQLALDAHQQVCGYGYGKSNVAHCLQDSFQLNHPF